jgi:hypothetical protein
MAKALKIMNSATTSQSSKALAVQSNLAMFYGTRIISDHRENLLREKYYAENVVNNGSAIEFSEFYQNASTILKIVNGLLLSNPPKN